MVYPAYLSVRATVRQHASARVAHLIGLICGGPSEVPPMHTRITNPWLSLTGCAAQ